MCPQPEETAATNGHSNGTNGVNASKEGFTGVQTKQNPHPTHKSPYQPVGDFLSNVGRFKIIGTSSPCPSSPLSDAHAAPIEVFAVDEETLLTLPE